MLCTGTYLFIKLTKMILWNLKLIKNYTIAWFAFVWLQFVLQFDEEAITWTCNDLQKIWQAVSDIAKK